MGRAKIMEEGHFRSEYEQVSDQLYTFLLRTLGDPDLASDILQEAAYRAYRSRNQFRGDSSFKTWIYRIAVNTMKNHWVRSNRERKWFDEVLDTPSVETPSPERIVFGKESTSRLSQALMMLEEGYRAPFMLKHVDGLSYSEISQVLDIAENNARVRVHRARNALRRLLREDVS